MVHVLDHTGLHVVLKVLAIGFDLAAKSSKRAGHTNHGASGLMILEVSALHFVPASPWTGYGVHRAILLVRPNYVLVYTMKATKRASDNALGTLTLNVCVHILTEYLDRAVIQALQFDVGTAFTVGGRQVPFTLMDLEGGCAAMLFVGAEHLQLFGLSADLLHEDAGEVGTATMWAVPAAL